MARYDASMESMAEMYVFETTGLLEQLDEILMRTEKSNSLESEDINEIFRIMHTIKGSSAMMGLENMSKLAHSIEDMFFVLRENPETKYSMKHLYELVFTASDSLKAEIEMIQEDTEPTDFTELMARIHNYIDVMKSGEDVAETASPSKTKEELSTKATAKPKAKTRKSTAKTATAVKEKEEVKEHKKAEKAKDITTVRVFFEDDCQMENLRAMILLNAIREECDYIDSIPPDVETNPETAKDIVDNGFIIKFHSLTAPEDIYTHIENALNVKSYEVIDNEEDEKPVNEGTPEKKEEPVKEALKPEAPKDETPKSDEKPSLLRQDAVIAAGNSQQSQNKAPVKQSLISVNLNKLDHLLDMVGEIVITEAMVVSNPDLKGLKLENFNKAARQLRKLTDELQDVVMSIRMVPLSGVFNKMSRIVRDMNLKLGKDVDLVFHGEDTEVDKSIIDNLNDPMMHLVRNAMDHGIETPEEYAASGKTEKSTVTLSAFNTSGEVVIIVNDNGKGINKEKVLAKAKENGVLTKDEKDYTDREIYNLIMAPGFSMNTEVTEFSGRGVGTDVVKKNIEKIGGSVSVESKLGEGTSFIIKIPLSLAIVDGMEISVGDSIFTIPTTAIRESFKISDSQLVHDTENGEMIMLRGNCYPLIRLHEIFGLTPKSTDLKDGIIVVVEADGKTTCLFADELIGEQQVVVKPFSPLLNKYNVKQKGMAGCSILGDGSITIILDMNNIINEY